MILLQKNVSFAVTGGWPTHLANKIEVLIKDKTLSSGGKNAHKDIDYSRDDKIMK